VSSTLLAENFLESLLKMKNIFKKPTLLNAEVTLG